MTNNVGFLSLVREEFLARGIPDGDKVSFCKVKKELSKENFEGDFMDSLIDDRDLPKGEAKVWWLPINAQRFPKVCAAMTGESARSKSGTSFKIGNASLSTLKWKCKNVIISFKSMRLAWSVITARKSRTRKASGWKASQSLRSAAGKIFFIAIRFS